MDFLMLLPIFVTGVGMYMLVKLRFFFIVHPVKTGKRLFAALRKKENFSALALALAGTLGVGNIFGVAMGIIVGGAGSLFWLFISAFFSMAIKYSEAVLSADNISIDSDSSSHGGMHYVLKRAFTKHGGKIGAVYAALAMILSFTMGASLQSRSIAGAVEKSIGTSSIIVLAVILISVSAAVLDGISKIEKITAKVIPLTTVIYIFICFLAIFSNIERIPEAIKLIFKEAFSLRSAGGGVGAYLLIRAIKEGYNGGVLSNEAGVGTSAMAHARACEATPHERGLFGICEVLFDTVFLCMLTGLVILIGVENIGEYNSGMALVSDAFANTLGNGARYLLLVLVFAFAYSTIVCWYYYGSECRRYLFGKKYRTLFAVLFFGFIMFGVFAGDLVSVRLTDTVLLLMSVPTLISIIKSSDRIVHLSELDGFLKKPKKLQKTDTGAKRNTLVGKRGNAG